MKAELTLPPELVDLITDKFVEKLKPIISVNDRHESEDTIFDVKGLCEYLKVSSKWVYEKTQYKEIPYLKLKGNVRFRKRDIDKWLNSHNVPVVSTPQRILKAIR